MIGSSQPCFMARITCSVNKPGWPETPISTSGWAQCNNSYIFPGIGLGVVASKAKLISDEMLMAASNALASASPLVNTGQGSLLPPLAAIAEISREIAFEVGKVAMEQGLALEMSEDALRASIERNFWKAEYRPYKRVSI